MSGCRFLNVTFRAVTARVDHEIEAETNRRSLGECHEPEDVCSDCRCHFRDRRADSPAENPHGMASCSRQLGGADVAELDCSGHCGRLELLRMLSATARRPSWSRRRWDSEQDTFRRNWLEHELQGAAESAIRLGSRLLGDSHDREPPRGFLAGLRVASQRPLITFVAISSHAPSHFMRHRRYDPVHRSVTRSRLPNGR
jgi:hypothetical protein